MNEKIGNLLNIAINATESDRQTSDELDMGYSQKDDEWELIIRYTGDVSFLEKYGEMSPVLLLGNYAIIKIKEQYIDALAGENQIIFIEKPTPLYFSVIDGIRASCITSFQGSQKIYGEGVIVGIVDSGIDYSHPAFRNEDGTTRIFEIWDQSVNAGNPPQGYNKGTVFYSDEINRALSIERVDERYGVVPSRDNSGHGTHVAGIAAGNFANNKNNNVGIATKSELIVVKLANSGEKSFPGTVELMEAVDYVARRAEFYGKPLALNISIGNSYGSHDGTALLETYLDAVAGLERISIAVGSGNEGAARGHTSGRVEENEIENVELAVSPFERSLNVQIWKNYVDVIEIEVISPSANVSVILNEYNSVQRVRVKNSGTSLLAYYGTPKPYSKYQEIYVEFVPDGQYIEPGIWTIRLKGVKIVSGLYDMWLPSAYVLGEGTGFLFSTADTTLTIPSTAQKVITVGAYDALSGKVADFSGRGYTRETNQIKPDIVAPGVNVRSAAPGGGYRVLSGTSMATPFVTGSLALMMEWGDGVMLMYIHYCANNCDVIFC